MSPLPQLDDIDLVRLLPRRENVGLPTDKDALVLEAWAEGYMVGSLIIMSCITLANMRRGVLLHKLILLELVLGYWQGFYILFNPPIASWWLSVAAIFLNASWSLHNVIAWMKLKPFLSKNVSRFFIGTIILVQPYWVVEIYANFTYFHNINDVFLKTRPWEALCRDPWWIAAAVFLVYNIKSKYDLSLAQIVRISPRFAVMLAAMFISIIFIVLDVLSVTSAMKLVLPVGINPFWKLSFVFKCLTDSVVLDDFKTALDRLRAFKISRLGSFAIDPSDERSRQHHESVFNANSWSEPPPPSGEGLPRGNIAAMESPDGDYIQPPWSGMERAAAKRNEQEKEKENVSPTTDTRTSESQDLDSKDTGVEAIDYADTPREASESHMLSQQQPWPPQNNEDAIDVDEEYALALREMTNVAPHDTLGAHKGA